METDGIISTERKREVLGVVLFVFTFFLFFSLITDGYEASQDVGRPLDGMVSVPNRLGAPGAFTAGVLSVLVGDAAHVVYAITFIWTLKLLIRRPVGRIATRLVGLMVLIAAVGSMLHIDVSRGYSNMQAGGVMGALLAERMLMPNFGLIGSNIMGAMLAAMGMLLATDFLFVHFFYQAYRAVHWIFKGVGKATGGLWRALRWLGGEDEEKTETIKHKTADALEMIPAFCAEIPEAAHGASPILKERRLSWVSTFVKWCKPTLRRHDALESPDYPDEQGQEYHAPEASSSGTAVKFSSSSDHDMSGGKQAAIRINGLPFNDIPEDSKEPLQTSELNDEDSGPCLESDEERGFSLDDLFPESAGELNESAEDNSSSDVKDSAGMQQNEERAARVDANDRPNSLDADESEVSEAAKKKPTRKLVRKTIEVDDLPDDYVYPDVYAPPALDLFVQPERRIIPNLRERLGQTATRLEETLATFGLEARVTDVTRGPTITRFELEPAPGMKVSRFLSLTDDIALALKAKGVRVEAPIPGKGRVGIEVSNEERDPVVIRELLEHATFRGAKNRLDLALGKDIAGDVCIADLMRMPHLLVAGATGSGKTVCIKALLASLLFQHTPDDLQLMLIDPKMVELSIFNDIPHLITPVVTDPKKAAGALTWLINEMEERYRLFADLRVRNIEVYNASVENGEIEMEGEEGVRKARSLSVVRKLPFIVCVIDELADLMMLARAEVEDAIARLAQLARAVGIHLIIATQRPSVDVLTGVIKANFPARISFQVSSRVDSRCILDEIGAERLIGMGDMLYLPAGQSKPARIQGAFVSDSEMMALIAYLKRQAPPQYRDEIANYGKNKEVSSEMEQEDDPLFEDAVRVVLDTGQASISMVQRRLRVGYTRAARLIDMMELRGIVGPHTGSKAREILVAIAAKDEMT